MDQYENQTTTNNNNISQHYSCYSHFLIVNKTLVLHFLVPLLFSLLFLSFLVISSSPPFPFFYFFSISSSPYNNFHSSPFVFPLTLQRKYIFLICNAILAFLGNKYSSFTSPPLPPAVYVDDHPPIPRFDNFANLVISDDDHLPAVTKQVSLLQVNDESTLEGAILSQENEALAEELEKGYLNIEEESGALNTETQEKIQDAEDAVEEEEGDSVNTKQTYPEEETNEANVNADELNKKFEEFIRKMKKEIRIEAQQQLIAV